VVSAAIAAPAAVAADSAGNGALLNLYRDASINIIYGRIHLHFKNFASKLKILAMLASFTGRLTATLPVVGVIRVVVSVPV
jgi:hypothetical protein